MFNIHAVHFHRRFPTRIILVLGTHDTVATSYSTSTYIVPNVLVRTESTSADVQMQVLYVQAVGIANTVS